MRKMLYMCLLSLLVLSCKDEGPAWINLYDPDASVSKRSEICGEVECGSVFFEGIDVVCGECTDDHYCTKDQKCKIRCEENICGDVILVTYFTDVDLTDCGKCADGELCGNSNICISNEDICDQKECGFAEFIDIESTVHNVECGKCDDDEYCTIIQHCVLKSAACDGKCGTVSVLTYNSGSLEIDCGGCTGEFMYCDSSNVCAEACKDKDCGTDDVVLDGGGNKTFECGDCGEGKNYCDNNYKCKAACVDMECGEESIVTFEGSEMIPCGTCTAPDYCDSILKCKTGTQSGSMIYDENIVIDTTMKIMWQRTNSAILTWADADNFCKTASTDGFDDWVLPDISKIRSIISGCAVAETCEVTSTCAESTCSNTDCNGCVNGSGSGPQGLYLAPDLWTYSGDANGRFWSSSSAPDKVDSYWFIRFSNASVAYNWDGSEYFVRCVREIK